MDYACILISSVHINWLHCAVVQLLVYTSQLIILGYTNNILLRICVLCDIQVQLQQLTNLDICVKEIFMVCQLLLHMAIATCMHVYVHSYIAVTIVLPNYTVNSLISYIANSQLTIELHTLITCQLCCNALKINLLCSILCSRTRLLSDYYSIYIQFCTSNSLHVTETFVKDCFIRV